MHTAAKPSFSRWWVVLLLGLLCSLPAMAHDGYYWHNPYRNYGHHGWQRPYYPPPPPVYYRHPPPPPRYMPPPAWREPPRYRGPYPQYERWR